MQSSTECNALCNENLIFLTQNWPMRLIVLRARCYDTAGNHEGGGGGEVAEQVVVN